MRKLLSLGLALSTAIVLTVVAAVPSATAAGTVDVTSGDLGDWTVSQHATCGADATGSQAFVTGPDTPPVGAGSLEMSVGSDGDSFESIGTTALHDVPLADLTSLAYSTYVSEESVGGGGQQAAYLVLRLDYDNDDAEDDRFFFEPAYQTGAYGGDPVPDQGLVQGDVWQDWDALVGGWWSNNEGFGGPPLHTLAQVLADNPGATIINGANGGLRVVVGCGGAAWQGFVGNADGVVIGISGDAITYSFEPTPQCTTVCYVDDTGSDSNGGTSPADAKQTIQAALNQVSSGGEVRVLPGSYDETAAGSMPTSLGGTYQFGLFFHSSKPGITVMGVTAADVPITDASLTEADITTNATNNFGHSGMFVEAADTTIQGVEIGPNIPGDNKTIEVVADNFTLQYANLSIPGGGGSVYINDFSVGGTVVQAYHVLENVFDDGSSVDLASGAGYTGPVSGREIKDNLFDLNDNGFNGVSFNGTGGVPWFANPVGGAIVTGNTFENSTQFIRARGVYDNSQFDWESYWNDNDYPEGAAVALVTESPFDVQTATSGAFTNIRRIGGTIQGEVDRSVATNTILVKPGTYPEHVTLGHELTVKGANAGVLGNGVRGLESILTGSASGAVQITADDVTLDGFQVSSPSNGLGTGIHMASNTSGVLVTNNVISGNQMGIFANSDGPSAITDNLFDANNEPGAAGGTAIYSDAGSNGLVIDGNEFMNHTENNPIIFGAVAPGTHVDLTVSDNSFHDNAFGIYALAIDGGMFTGNDITTPAATALTFGGAVTDVDVTFNIIHDSLRGVRVIDHGYGFGDNADILVNRNALLDNAEYGVGNVGGYVGTLDATCNWWGQLTGPAAGDTSGSVDSLPWLTTPVLTGSCFGGTWIFQGFFRPVDNPTTINTAKAGQAIPVKWRILDENSVPINDPSSFISITSDEVNCGDLPDAGESDAIENYVNGAGLRAKRNGNWQFNWFGPTSYKSSCRILTLTLADGSQHDAYFKFKA